MSQTIPAGRSGMAPELSDTSTRDSIYTLPDVIHNPVYQAYKLLYIAFVLAPILAGLDKFFHLLVNWDQYLAPIAIRIEGIQGQQFTHIVGIVEIIAGIGVLWKPMILAYVVAVWMIVNLLLIHGYCDAGLRDLGLCLAALVLGRLSAVYDR